MSNCPCYQHCIWETQYLITSDHWDELLAAAMLFQFTDYWRNNIDRPLNLFNTTDVFENKLEPIGSALIDFQSRWLIISDWESGFSIRLKCKNTLKIKFKSGCVKSKSQKTGLESDSSPSPGLEYWLSKSLHCQSHWVSNFMSCKIHENVFVCCALHMPICKLTIGTV